MKKYIFSLLTIILIASVLYAAPGITISFQTLTTAQDTYVQTILIPQANTLLCANFGLASNCTSSQLTTAGCTAAPASGITKNNLVYRNCAPFTLDAAGESLFVADIFATALLPRVAADSSTDSKAFCTAFKAASVANQNSICTTLGRPNGCVPCQ